MTRIEQLTLDLLDGVLDPAGLDELERLLNTDAEARAAHFALCQQEAALRGHFSAVDVSSAAMARVRQAASGGSGRMEEMNTSAGPRIPLPPPPPVPGLSPGWPGGGGVPWVLPCRDRA